MSSTRSNNANWYSKTCSFAQKTIGRIYPWDNMFKFTTLALSAYTLGFVLLFYLTCVFIFQSMIGTNSMHFLIFCLEEIFHIGKLNRYQLMIVELFILSEIDDWSFHYQIFISGILTCLIFTIQLFYGIVKYKEHTKQLKENKYDEIPSKQTFERNSIGPQSVRYLSSIFLNTVGGFFIWFHTILFIINICSIIIYYAYTLQIEYLHPLFTILSFILPLIVLYGLNRYIKQWLCTFASSKESEHTSFNKSNEKIYAILIYFTLIFSKRSFKFK